MPEIDKLTRDTLDAVVDATAACLSRKRCPKCEQELAVTKFNKNRSRHDGLSGYCRSCGNASLKKWRAENLARTRATARKWYKENFQKVRVAYRKWRAANPEKVRAAGRKWCAANPEQVRARWQVKNALKTGRLVRLSCENCGEKERVDGHHEIYDEPLTVTWLCRKCHRKLHRYKRGLVA